MGLFDKFKKKKEEVSEGQIILSMPLFKDSSTYSVSAIVEDLKTYWGLSVTEVSGDNDNASFVVDGETVVIGLMPTPIPSGEFEALYSHSYMWNNVEEEVRSHTSHAIVSLLSSSKSAVERYIILTKINASILRTTDGALGIYQGSATLLLPKNLYVDFASMLLEGMLPVQLWVYFGIVNYDEEQGLYTYGMKEFSKTEMEIINPTVNLEQSYDFLTSIVSYVLGQNVILKAGETIGFTAEQKVEIEESKAMYLDGVSLKLKL